MSPTVLLLNISPWGDGGLLLGIERQNTCLGCICQGFHCRGRTECGAMVVGALYAFAFYKPGRIGLRHMPSGLPWSPHPAAVARTEARCAVWQARRPCVEKHHFFRHY